ncbi:MAG: AAA family ATPase, partial [Rubrobacteraceae bacterium]
MAKELPPVRWIVPGILPEGVTLLVGKPKLGKSWLALGLCIAVASGGVALGKRSVERGEVLYLALEDNERRLQKRIDKMLAGGGAPDGLHLATAWPRVDEGGAEELEGWLEAHPDARLVVVDVLQRVRPRTGNSNVYEADYEAVRHLQPLAATFGVGVVVVHHTRKMSAADPIDEISGSLGLSGAADGTLILKRDRGRGDAYLHVDGRDVEDPAELALTWNADTAGWTLAGDADEFRLSQERTEILHMLEETGEPMTPTEVADALDKKPNAVKQRLWRMSKDGQVSADGGRYACVTRNPHNPDNREEGHGYDTSTPPITGPAVESGEDKPSSANGYGGYGGSELRGEHDDGERPPITCIHGYPEGRGCYLCDPG